MSTRREIEVVRQRSGWTPRVKGGLGNETPSLLMGASRRIAILIHGYNTDPGEARDDYNQFRADLRQIGVRPDIYESIWNLYWPAYVPKGNWGWWRETMGKYISRGSYPLQLSKAKAIGEKLAIYFEQTPTLTGSRVQLVLIGHSLGCRLVLEILAHQAALTNRVPGICLMAAAVPVFDVRAGAKIDHMTPR
jgi:hypothetical protein